MANIRKKISELTALTSASLDTTLVGVDGGTTYKIELDTLADAVTSRVNILDRDRLSSLESVTSSFETKGRSVISSSAQITTLGFISSSTTIPTGTISSSAQITSFGFVSSSIDISSLNSFTSSQSSLNTAFTNGINARLQTSSFDTFSQSVDSRLIAATNEQSLTHLVTTSSFNEYTASQSTSSLVNRLNTIESVSGSWITESETGSFLTSLSGAISSSSQLTSSFDTRYVASGSISAVPAGTISGSAQITTLGFISSSQTINTASLATTGSNSFNGNQTITGSLVVGSVAVVNGGITVPTGSTITLTSGSSLFVDASGSITSLGGITGSIAATNGVVSGSSQLISSFPSKTTGNWTVPAGASTQSFSVESGASYTMWVNGNIPNGIITWNATVTTSNTNVPVVGFQYGWYYTAGNALVLTSMPDQIVGTNGSIVTSPASYAPNTSNVFKFGITNNSGTSQTINYGYIKLS